MKQLPRIGCDLKIFCSGSLALKSFYLLSRNRQITESEDITTGIRITVAMKELSEYCMTGMTIRKLIQSQAAVKISSIERAPKTPAIFIYEVHFNHTTAKRYLLF